MFDLFKNAPALPDYVRVLRSSRRTVAIQIAPDGAVIVRAPQRMAAREIARFVAEHDSWIQKHRALRLAAAESAGDKLSDEEIRAMKKRARELILPRVEHYASLLGVSYGRVSIRCQKSRWGSCSSKGDLSFNCLLAECPAEVLDSVVVHELCHRIEMNHSGKFYAHVYRVFPQYDSCHRWLKQNGGTLMARAHGE